MNAELTLRPGPRDLRIDFVRGLALLIIAVDHIHFNVLGFFTPRNFGFSDMADLFVFLSGYACGSAYQRVLESRGFGACQRKAVLRAFQLFLAYTVTLATIRLILAGWPEPGPVYISAIDDGGLGVLFVYILPLLTLPAMLSCQRQYGNAAMIGLSMAVYTGAPFLSSGLALPPYWHQLTGFNPLAWQFLFFLAVAVAVKERTNGMPIFPRAWISGAIALAVLEGAVLVRIWCSRDEIPLVDKGNLGLLRVVHLFALVIALNILLPANGSRFWRHRLVQPVLLCGQNSLVSFCVGAVLSTVGTQILARSVDRLAAHIFLSMAVCAGCILAVRAWKLMGIRAAPNRRAQLTNFP